MKSLPCPTITYYVIVIFNIVDSRDSRNSLQNKTVRRQNDPGYFFRGHNHIHCLILH
jgi:hypothetical protein